MAKHQTQAFREASILRAARHGFVTVGFAASTMDAIAKQAGLSKGGLYFRFASKNELLRALLNNELNKAAQFMNRYSESITNTKTLRELGKTYWSFMTQEPDRARFFVLMNELSLYDPEVRRLVRAIHKVYVNAMHKMFMQAGYSTKAARSLALAFKAYADGMAMATALEVNDIAPDWEHFGADLLQQEGKYGKHARRPAGGSRTQK